MSFWEKALGAPAQTAPEPAQTSQPWFVPATPTPVAVMPQPQHQPEPTVQPSRAQSSKISSMCPECGSDHLFRAGGGNFMEKCFDCGWNPRFSHSGSGAGMPSGNSAPSTPARQISTSNNYNPGTIIGRVQ